MCHLELVSGSITWGVFRVHVALVSEEMCNVFSNVASGEGT